MPVQRCNEEGLPGYRWGADGKCYTYPKGAGPQARRGARLKAQRQGVAVSFSQKEAGEKPDLPVEEK